MARRPSGGRAPVKVPGDALSGPAGLRLPSSLRGGGQHHEKPPLQGIPHWASALRSLLEKRRQPQCAQSLHGLRLSMLNCSEDRSASQALPQAATGALSIHGATAAVQRPVAGAPMAPVAPAARLRIVNPLRRHGDRLMESTVASAFLERPLPSRTPAPAPCIAARRGSTACARPAGRHRP